MGDLFALIIRNPGMTTVEDVVGSVVDVEEALVEIAVDVVEDVAGSVTVVDVAVDVDLVTVEDEEEDVGSVVTVVEDVDGGDLVLEESPRSRVRRPSSSFLVRRTSYLFLDILLSIYPIYAFALTI